MRKIISPLRGFESPLSAAALSIYAVNNFDPALVFDFDDEYYRTSGAKTTFESAISHNSTSTTNGTMVDSDGLIKWRPHNLALNSASPATQSITVISGADYTIECTGVSIAVSGAGTGTVTEGNPVTITASTTTLTLTVTGSTGTMWVYRSDLGGMVNNPDTSNSYVPTTTAARYLPRRGHHVWNGSAWVNEGLLVESEARTNLITQSNAFTTTWTDSNATPASAAATGPDGETSMWNLVDDGGTGTGEVYLDFAVTVAVDTTYTFSAYVKANDLSWCALGTENFTTPGNVETYFDLSTGAVGTEGTGHTATISDEGGGIYRISITFTSDSSDTSGNVRIYVADADTDNTVDLDGTSSIYVYGAQLEQGKLISAGPPATYEDAPTPSSYIPTNGATATRGAETLTVAAADLPYDSTNMSIQMDGRMTYADTGNTEVVWFIWQFASSNYIQANLRTQSTATGEVYHLQAANGVADDVDGRSSQYSPGILVPYNIASRHGATFINGAVDGTALTADTTPTALPDLSTTDLSLGDDYMGTIRTFRMWAKDLTDEGIEEAST